MHKSPIALDSCFPSSGHTDLVSSPSLAPDPFPWAWLASAVFAFADVRQYFAIVGLLANRPRRKGRTDEAIRQLQEALRLKPEIPEARERLARALQTGAATAGR